MAITFACETCGKQMQAKEDFAGRKMRCPGCSAVLTIPSGIPEPVRRPRPAAPAPLARRVTAPPPEDALTLNEDAIADEEATAEPSTPLPTPRRSAPPPRAAEPTMNIWVDPCLSQSSTPWEEQDRQRLGIKEDGPDRRGSWGPAVVLLLVVLLAGGVAGYLYQPQVAQALHTVRQVQLPEGDLVDERGRLVIPWESYSDAELVPASATLAARFQVRQWLADTRTQPAKLPAYPFLGEVRLDLEEMLGVKLSQVDSVTVFVLPSGKGHFTLLRLLEPYQPNDRDNNWQGVPLKRPQPVLRPAHFDPKLTLVHLHPNLLLLGPTDAVPELLQTKPSSSRADAVITGLRLGDKSHLTVVAQQVQELLRPFPITIVAPIRQSLEPVLELQNLTLTVTEQGPLQVKARATFSGVVEAAQAGAAIQAATRQAKEGAPVQLSEIIDALQVEIEGKQLDVSGQLPGQLLEQFGRLIPRQPRPRVPAPPPPQPPRRGKGKRAGIVA